MKKATMSFWGWYSRNDVYKKFLWYISDYKKTNGNVNWTLSGSPNCDMTDWLIRKIDYNEKSQTTASLASKQVELI